MKKLFSTLIVLLVMSVSTVFAQQKGDIYIGGNFDVGVAGDVAFGIHFNGAPITLAVDYRPTVLLLNDNWGGGFASVGLSCVVRF